MHAGLVECRAGFESIDCCIQFYCDVYLSISGGNSRALWIYNDCTQCTATWPVFCVHFLSLCSALQNTLDLLLCMDNGNSRDTI